MNIRNCPVRHTAKGGSLLATALRRAARSDDIIRSQGMHEPASTGAETLPEDVDELCLRSAGGMTDLRRRRTHHFSVPYSGVSIIRTLYRKPTRSYRTLMILSTAVSTRGPTPPYSRSSATSRTSSKHDAMSSRTSCSSTRCCCWAPFRGDAGTTHQHHRHHCCVLGRRGFADRFPYSERYRDRPSASRVLCLWDWERRASSRAHATSRRCRCTSIVCLLIKVFLNGEKGFFRYLCRVSTRVFFTWCMVRHGTGSIKHHLSCAQT